MNRETKRMLQRQNAAEDLDVEARGDTAVRTRPAVSSRSRTERAGSRAPARQRTTPAQFFREIRDEMRQVAWPTRSELINYSVVVLVTLVIMVSLIFVLNLLFGKGIFFMFDK